MNRIFAVMLLICMACGQPTLHDQADTPLLPNIVLLVGDDQGYPYFGFMGADYVQTPHMDRLAESGVVFTNGYVPTNHCRPSLQTLMTGTIPLQYEKEVENLILNDSTYQGLSEGEQAAWARNFRFHAMQHFQTLPRILSDYGYVSWQGGKWWEFNYQNGGFDRGMTKGWTEEDEQQSDWFLKLMGGDGTELGRTTMQPVYDFIDAHGDQPFFIWYAPELPHYPFDAPARYYDLYKEEEMTESAKRYYANCTWFDDGVGELVSYLKEKGEYEKTLFVYVNDNGWEQHPDQEFRHDSLRWHNGGDKGKIALFDMSFHTPILFSWSGMIDQGQVRQDLIHSADIPATILDFLKVPVPAHYYGQSYKPVITSEKGASRKVIIGRATQMRSEEDMMGRKIEGYWLRNEEWFYKWNVTDQHEALFNMKTDPFNDRNLAQEEPERVAAYRAEVEAWKAEVETSVSP